MLSWIQSVANWASMLYRNNDEETRETILTKWLQKSTGWLQGLRPILPPYPAKHTYVKYRLVKTDVLEVSLIAWGEHASTPIHDRSAANGGSWMRVIQGCLYEESAENVHARTTGFVGYREGPLDMQRIHTLQPAYSIHIDSPCAL